MRVKYFSVLIDTLVNAMEHYQSPQDFVRDMQKRFGINRQMAETMFEKYWEVDAMERFEWDYPEWSDWLYSNFGLEESAIKIKEAVKIRQKDVDILLEEGDMIKVLTKKKEEVDAKKVIKDLAKSYGSSNEEQGKLVSLLRGLAFSDDKDANKFMKALDKWTSEYAKNLE